MVAQTLKHLLSLSPQVSVSLQIMGTDSKEEAKNPLHLPLAPSNTAGVWIPAFHLSWNPRLSVLSIIPHGIQGTESSEVQKTAPSGLVSIGRRDSGAEMRKLPGQGVLPFHTFFLSQRSMEGRVGEEAWQRAGWRYCLRLG